MDSDEPIAMSRRAREESWKVANENQARLREVREGVKRLAHLHAMMIDEWEERSAILFTEKAKGVRGREFVFGRPI